MLYYESEGLWTNESVGERIFKKSIYSIMINIGLMFNYIKIDFTPVAGVYLLLVLFVDDLDQVLGE